MSKTQSRWISFSGRALATVALMTTGGFLLHAQTPRRAEHRPQPCFGSGTDSQPADRQADSERRPTRAVSARERGMARQSCRRIRPSRSISSTRCSMAAAGSGTGVRSTGAGTRTPTARRSRTSMWAADFGCRSATSSTMRRRAGVWRSAAAGCSTSMVGVNLEFRYDHFGMTATADRRQLSLHSMAIRRIPNGFRAGQQPCVVVVAAADFQHQVRRRNRERTSPVAVGFYHKVTNFTVPRAGTRCDPYLWLCISIRRTRISTTTRRMLRDSTAALALRISSRNSRASDCMPRFGMCMLPTQYKPGVDERQSRHVHGQSTFSRRTASARRTFR